MSPSESFSPPDFGAGDAVQFVGGEVPARLRRYGRYTANSGLKKLGVYRVTSVEHAIDDVFGVTLAGVQHTSRCGFPHFYFRSIRAPGDELTARIRACQPLKAKERAGV